MDEQRIGKLGDYFKKFAESHSQVLPLIGKCLDGISEAGNAVSPTGVSRGRNRSSITLLVFGPFSIASLVSTFTSSTK